MRYVSFYDPLGVIRPGVVRDRRISPIDLPTMREYIALAPHERAAHHSEQTYSLDRVRLTAPVMPARNVFCVGRNYLEHAKEGARASGRELKLPDVPTFFTKAPTAIADPGADLHLQADVSSEYDFEAELAVVIGERCKNVTEGEALGVVFGYTCLNDVTARDRQRAHVQWFKGKSLDDTCPLGPWIVSPDEIGNPQNLSIGITIDGEEKQNSSTSQMIFGIARIIAELSKGMTLLPGDVIATGTPDGVGFARTPPEFLADGTAMAVTIENIGTLGNVVRLS
jgi:2-keto-4-pentenoate hydratase/2-oxohepta-3-ene-1,7-dioic acid hydratase in catechol pathway